MLPKMNGGVLGLKAQEQAKKQADLEAKLNKVNDKLIKGSIRHKKNKHKKLDPGNKVARNQNSTEW